MTYDCMSELLRLEQVLENSSYSSDLTNRGAENMALPINIRLVVSEILES